LQRRFSCFACTKPSEELVLTVEEETIEYEA